jgi:hypothetical protein
MKYFGPLFKCMQNPDDDCVTGGFVSIFGTEVEF